MSVKQVLLIRRDLHMRRGKEIAQCAHASLGVIIRGSVISDQTLTYPIPQGTEIWFTQAFAKITLQVHSEAELLSLVGKAQEAGIPACAIQDSGKTEFHGVPTWTAGAIGPWGSEAIDAITGHLKLY